MRLLFESLQNLFLHKTRSSLAILGIVFGNTPVIAYEVLPSPMAFAEPASAKRDSYQSHPRS